MKIIREKSGFSLVGTMVVIAIIGMMIAIAIPNLLEWLPVRRVNGAIRNLAADMQWTRMKAVADNNDYVICFDTTENAYSIYESDTCPTEETSQIPKKRVNISAEYPGITYGCNDNDDIPSCASGQRFQPTGLAPPPNISVYLIP